MKAYLITKLKVVSTDPQICQQEVHCYNEKEKLGTRKYLSNLTGTLQGLAFLSIEDFTLAEMMKKK